LFRKNTIDRFGQVFEKGTSNDEEDEQKSASLTSKWGWYNVVFSLCLEDITKIKEITNLELYMVLTYLSYQQDKSSIENNNYGNI